MMLRRVAPLMLAGLAACSDGPTGAPGTAPGAAVVQVLPVNPENYTLFVEPGTGFMTDEVHDADREVVHFDEALDVMVSGTTGTTVGGWEANGTELGWSRSGIPFQVRFGTEQGERRAYFTEAGPGTICNLRIAGLDQLSISATNETPPNP